MQRPDLVMLKICRQKLTSATYTNVTKNVMENRNGHETSNLFYCMVPKD